MMGVPSRDVASTSDFMRIRRRLAEMDRGAFWHLDLDQATPTTSGAFRVCRAVLTLEVGNLRNTLRPIPPLGDVRANVFGELAAIAIAAHRLRAGALFSTLWYGP
jgi:hypothetical protein